MAWVVTGVAGFIGSSLAHHLAAASVEVRGIDDLSSGRLENVPDACQLTVGSICSAPLEELFEGADVVVHLAAQVSVPASVQDPLHTHHVNDGGTVAVLEAARLAGVRRVIFASSAAVYGAGGDGPLSEDAPTAPLSPYAASKLAGEAWCSCYREAYGVETTVLRFFNVYGPRQILGEGYAAVIPIFIDTVRRGGTPTIFGDGGQTRDFIYIDDLVRAIVASADAPEASGATLNIAGGAPTSIAQTLDHVAAAVGVTASPRFEPERAGDVRHSLADIRRVQTLLGFTPEVTIAEGLRRTVRWADST